MVKQDNYSFSSSDGVHSIHVRAWEPEQAPRAAVQLVHGVAEHIGRYDAFASFLAENGIAAAGTDHLGHGLTAQDESERGWFAETDGWNKIVLDERSMHDILRSRYPGIPLILLGHSMGSFMARTYIGRFPQDFDLCILSGTGHTPGLVCRAGMALARSEIRKHGSKYRSKRLQDIAFGSYLRGIEDPLGPNDWICRDKDVIRAYDADPLCGFAGTAGLMYDMMSGLALIGSPSHIAKMDKSMPVLFISGEADPVGGWGKGVRQAEERFRRAGMRDVQALFYPDMRHEVLNEIGKEQVWQDVLGWIDAHTAPGAAGRDARGQ